MNKLLLKNLPRSKANRALTELSLIKNKFIRPTLLRKLNNKITAQDIALFFRQLATLIAAGIPIVQSCDILKNSQAKQQLRQLINALKYEMEAGKSLVIGLQKFPDHFDNLTCHLINAGEQTGTLEIMLKRIANYKEKSIKLKNQIKQALFYPSMIFVVAITVSLIMLTFIVPRFADLFQSMHGKLPTFTCFIILISDALRNNLLIITALMICSFISLYYVKSFPSFKTKFDFFILKVPLVSVLIKKVILTRLTRNLATTYAAGVPILDALSIIANISGNNEYTKAIKHLQTDIMVGKQLHIAMQATTLFPPMTLQMVKVGEESGKLEAMLEKIADIYEAEIDHFINNLSHMLEPLIMIILGVLIGGLVIAMYLPIFKLGTVI